MKFKRKSEQVIFTDDGKEVGRLTVVQATLADEQVRDEMERLAEDVNIQEAKLSKGGLTPTEIKKQNFRLNIYPKLAACSVGADVPNEDDAFEMPSTELFKWYDAAHRVNPSWFAVIDEIAAAYQKSKEAGLAAEKKSEAKPQESPQV